MSRDGVRTPLRVVIAGGGVAALEALLALRSIAGSRVEIRILAPGETFLYRPVTVAEAFDRGSARIYSLVEIVGARKGDRLIPDSLARVDPAEQVAITSSGELLHFDALVLATGATPSHPLPGALTFRGRPDVPALRELLELLASQPDSSVAVVLPAAGMWPLPIYELALMTSGFLGDRGAGHVGVTIVTTERQPLELFGTRASEALSELMAARGIAVRAASLPERVTERALLLAGGDEVSVQRVVTLPILRGRPIPGVPCDRDGFIPVDGHGRVDGLENVYAAGDVTAFPLKQGGLAAQAADVVAEAIAAQAGVSIVPAPFRPVLRGLLMTGGAPLYLRAEPSSDGSEGSVATDAVGGFATGSSEATVSGQSLWWPPAKIAGRYLAPYLAASSLRLASAPLLSDRQPVAGPPVSEDEHSAALGLALLLADCDARWGDYRSALAALDAAETVHGALPGDYEAKRREWRSAAYEDGQAAASHR